MELRHNRNENIEVLRVFLMLAIVTGHCCVHGVFKDDHRVWALAYMTSFSVNTFVFISGWYSIQLRWRKVCRLLGLGLFAAVVVSMLSPLILGNYSFVYSLGWFGNTYLALMLLAPFLNEGVEKLRADSVGMLWGIWAVYGALLVCGWLPLKALGLNIVPSGFGPFSISHMVFMYLTGRILVGYACENRISFSAALAIAMFCMIGSVGLVTIGHFYKTGVGFGRILNADLGAYSSPFVVAASVFFFLSFSRAKIPVPICRTCRFLAPSMFSVYLLHDGCNGEVTHHGVVMIERFVCDIIGNGVVSMYFTIFTTVVAVFFASVFVDLLRRFVCFAINGFWHKSFID